MPRKRPSFSYDCGLYKCRRISIIFGTQYTKPLFIPPHLLTVATLPWEISQVHVSLKHYCCTMHSLKNKFNCTTKRVQVQLLQQVFKMSSFFLNTGPKSLPPFVDSIINDTLQQSVPSVSQALLQIGHVSNWRLINMILQTCTMPHIR